MTHEPGPRPALPVRCLSIHARYACRQVGACCTSGWPIPVEPDVRVRLLESLASGTLAPAARGAKALDEEGWLGLDDRGRCLFYEVPGGACAIHRQLGEPALPMSCRQFPRVSLTDARGIHVSLSHYCPTAARLLFDVSVPLSVVDAPSAFPPDRPYEGLDARHELPPLVHPSLLHSLESYEAWEGGVVALFAGDRFTPLQALGQAAAAAERAREWTAKAGPLAAWIGRALARGIEVENEDAPDLGSPRTALRLWDLVRAAVPAGVEAPSRPADAVEAWRRLVAPGWITFHPVVRRYLAARAFAAWLAYQGRGVRTSVLGLVAAHGILQVEAARACAAAGRGIDEALLLEATRAADLLLLHLADPANLAGRLGVAEQAAGRAASPLEWLA